MDYLLRDSLHTGVKYGQFDLHRLVHTLTFTRDPETGDPVVALEAGVVHAAEGLILARYFMFQQVYYHPVRRVYDHHLR
jgi:HD superfamily phosphohydrolase